MSYQITLTIAELQTIGLALGQMPHDRVRQLIDNLQQQINAQEQAKQQAKEA